MRERAAPTAATEKSPGSRAPTVAAPPQSAPRQPARAPRVPSPRQLARDVSGRGMGNRATLSALAEAGVRVTDPNEALERQAGAVAAAVTRPSVLPVAVMEAEPEPATATRAARTPVAHVASGAGATVGHRSAALTEAAPIASTGVGARTAPVTPGPLAAVFLAALPALAVAPGGTAAPPRSVPLSPAAARAPPRPQRLPPVVAAGLTGGAPVDPGVRPRLTDVLGTDLGQMRVHTGPAAAEAAASVGARAFTLGHDVVLGAGESPTDLALMAHEATHVVQQTSGAARLAVARDEDDWLPDIDVTDIVPDWMLDQVRSLVRGLPGYGLVCAAIGQDLLSGEPVTLALGDTVETLLLAGPFGAGVSAVLSAMDLLGSIWTVITATLAEHRITIARITRDIESAWDELSLSNGVDGNVAVLRRYLSNFLADIRAAIGALVDQLIQAVRDAIVPVVEPYLTEGPLAPVWNLATKVLHYNPLTGGGVDATTVEIISDFLTLIGQDEVLAQMAERGTLQQTADWVDLQLAVFSSLIVRAAALFSDAWDAISPSNLPSLLDTLPGLASRAVELFSDVVAFGSTLIHQVLVFIRDSLLEWVSERAHGVRGFKLLTVILGRNPFTQAPVDRSAENLIGGFVELIAGPETYAQLAESGVIAEAAGRIEGELARLNITWDLITGTFLAIWEGLSLADFLDPPGAIERVITQFGEPLSRIISFAATVIQVVLELVLRLMNFPSDLLGSIISGVQQALSSIQADPVGFLNNLLAALKQGFSQFFDNILVHLIQGLADWLFRGLRGLGIEIPTELSGASILKLALDVMGLSVEFLWECLGEVIGQERVAMIRGAIGRLGQAWAFITDVQTRGMVAIWEYISSQLGNLWDTILTMAKDWLVTNLIDAAVAKVLSMLDPTGVMAVINSCIAFYRAVQSVIEYVTEILQIVKTYVDTIAAIAAGNIGPGATMLETGLANAIPVAIGFLASQVGLGNIPEKIVEIINGLRQAIKDAVVWLIRQALRLGQAALDALTSGGSAGTAPTDPAAQPEGAEDAINEPVAMRGAIHHLRNDGVGGALVVHSDDVLVNQHAAEHSDLRTLVDRFNAATSRAAREQAAKAIAAWFASHGLAGGPGGSAPGLGTTERHGGQMQGVRENPAVPLWSLRSEHVVPWAVVRGLWQVLGVEGMASRKDLRVEDNALTTIFIYLGAGKAKDSEEAGPRAAAQGQIAAMKADYESQPDVDTPQGDARAKGIVMNYLRNTVLSQFVGLTAACVEREWGTKAEGADQTNGELRAESAGLPLVGQIQAAAAAELVDAERIADLALAQAATQRPPAVGVARLASEETTVEPRTARQLAQGGLRITSVDEAMEQEAAAVSHAITASASMPTRAAAPVRTRAPPTASLPPHIGAALAGGAPVPHAVRPRLESALGTDLREMRVHTGSGAATAAASVGARAFTLGHHVVLGAGESTSDLGLMTHEAAHVVQQTGVTALMREVAPVLATAEPTPAPAMAPPVADTSDRYGSLDDAQFNAEMIAHDLLRAIDQTEYAPVFVSDGLFGLKEDVAAERRKVDVATVISRLQGLTEAQVHEVRLRYAAADKRAADALEIDLFGCGTSGRKARLTADRAEHIRILLLGTRAEASRWFFEEDARRNRIAAEAIELHDLLSKKLDDERLERVMALHRRPVAEIDILDACYEQRYGRGTLAGEFGVRLGLEGLTRMRMTQLRLGHLPQADAVAIEIKRRKIEELNRQDEEEKARKAQLSGQILGILPATSGVDAYLADKRRKERLKLTGDIQSIIEQNKREALADPANDARQAGDAIAARLGAILGQQAGEPGETLGAKLATTLQPASYSAIAAALDPRANAGDLLVNSAAARLVELEANGTTNHRAIEAILRSFRALAQRDILARVRDPDVALPEKQALADAGQRAVDQLSHLYVDAFVEAYNRMAAPKGRTYAQIVASASDANASHLESLRYGGGETSPLGEMDHAIATRDVDALKQVLAAEPNGERIAQLIGSYNSLGRNRSFYRQVFGGLGDTVLTAEQAVKAGSTKFTGGMVAGRDAALVGELLAKPGVGGPRTAGEGVFGPGYDEVSWMVSGGRAEYGATMLHRGTIRKIGEWTGDPETKKLMAGSLDRLTELQRQWESATDPVEKRHLFLEIRKTRATLTGDADAYEKETEAILDQIRSAVSFAVSIALAVALPGVGAGLGFLQATALNIAANVATNVLIKGDRYGWDDLKADVLGGALSAGGAKLGEALLGKVVLKIAGPVARGTGEAAEKAGIKTVLAGQAARLTSQGEKIAIEVAEVESRLAGRALAVKGATEIGNFFGGMYGGKLYTGDFGLTMTELLQGLAGTAAGKYGERRAQARRSAPRPAEDGSGSGRSAPEPTPPVPTRAGDERLPFGEGGPAPRRDAGGAAEPPRSQPTGPGSTGQSTGGSATTSAQHPAGDVVEVRYHYAEERYPPIGTAPPANPPSYRGRAGYDAVRIVEGDVRYQELVIKLHLDPGSGVTQPDLQRIQLDVVQGVQGIYNDPQHQLLNGDTLRVRVEFTSNPLEAHAIVDVGPAGGGRRADQFNWQVGDDPMIHAHEIGHHLGLPDEYVEGAFEPRPSTSRDRPGAPGVTDDRSIMGGYYERLRDVIDPGARLRERHLAEIGDAIAEQRLRNQLQGRGVDLTPGAVDHSPLRRDDYDTIGPKGELEVRPANVSDASLPILEQRLMMLRYQAARFGVAADAYFHPDAPWQARRLARAILGDDHVHINPDAPAPPTATSSGPSGGGDRPPATVSIMGAARSPQVKWATANPDGAVRSIAQAHEIARRHGVDIPDDVIFQVTIGKHRFIEEGALAQYFRRQNARGTDRITWDDFYSVLRGQEEPRILVRLDKSVLASDEMIVAVFAHEVHELAGLRDAFDASAKGYLTAEELARLINPGIKGNLHDEAWTVADELVLAMRAARTGG